MRGKRLVLGAVAVALTTTALLLGGVFRDSSGASPAAAPALQLTPTSTNELVARLQATLRMNPDDVTSLDSLGLAYQQRARETGDPTWEAPGGLLPARFG